MADNDEYDRYYSHEGDRSEGESIFGEQYLGEPHDADSGVRTPEFGTPERDNWESDLDEFYRSQGIDPERVRDARGDEFRAFRDDRIAAANYAQEMARRREYGLEGDKIFGYASRLADVAEGRRKTAGQIEAERQLKILSGAQRGFGAAQARGSFEAADLLRAASGAAQAAETEGESAIADAARQARLEAGAQLEQLLIQGQQRAEDRAFAMQQLAFQQEQASSSLWSNVLGGILGAVGGTIGFFAGGPAGAAAGATIGTGGGKAFGSYIG
jgi:hypothetical protein